MTTAMAGLEVRMSAPVQAALAAIGRTEDLRFSPDNRLLAIAGFTNDQILLLRVRIEATDDGPRVSSDTFMTITSGSLRKPHGVDFIDDETLVIANRHGDVCILKIPTGEPDGRTHHVKAVRILRAGRFHKIKTPGSVGALHEADGKISILVCNNYTHVVTRHLVDPANGYRVVKHSVFCRAGLDIPDGISVNRDGDLVAISSHHTNDVKLFAAAGSKDMEATYSLVESNFPHGIRFTPDDSYVLVADAGAPVIHIYARGEGWQRAHRPSHSFTVLDDATFQRGRVNVEEGGPKGIDIDNRGQVLAVTCEEQVLSFYSLAEVLALPRI